MITVLTGDNGFALERGLDELVAPYVAEHGDLGLERIDGRETDAGGVREAITNMPLLAARKMLVFKGLGANKQVVEQVEQLFDDIPETTDVVIVEPRFDKRLNYYKFLKKRADLREFNEPDAAGLARWLVEAAKESGGSISFGDARYLVERVGSSQQLLSSELEKLLLYDSKITRQTIDLLTDPAPQSTVFQLLEAAFAGDKRRALKLYADQRAQNVEPAQIIAMLAWQLHVLAVIKTAGERPADTIAKEAGINPFVVRKSQGIARNTTMARLKTLVNDLLRVDVGTKRTSADPDEALQHYLLKLAKS
ncbi:MAG TPA: DNA polymerase III subunit delta [Candidatus Saccharimonadales bacterium]|nr:DNA polymerase III subunit delta [Candidatus Saccharimonadales bacterium]